MRVAVVVSLCAALAAPARAGGDDEERARGHYEIGLGLYRLGDYHGALKEFAAGYELAHKPGFLLNLGQTYRKLGELREARDLYRQFLVEVRADDPARAQAQKVLAEIEEAIRTRPPPRAAPPPTPAPSPVAPATASDLPPTAATSPTPPPPVEPPPPAVVAPSLAASAPPQRPRNALRIAGITVGVVGLGLVGGGVGTAVAADGVARDLSTLDHAGGVFDPAKDHEYTVDRTLSAVFFASGAALAATGAVLLIVSGR
ncbi:MAG: tetratricopeptide repeat protein [Polyangia bacterium]